MFSKSSKSIHKWLFLDDLFAPKEEDDLFKEEDELFSTSKKGGGLFSAGNSLFDESVEEVNSLK